jgi:hypothetical protein
MLMVYLSIAVVIVLREVNTCDRWLLEHKTTGGDALKSQT